MTPPDDDLDNPLASWPGFPPPGRATNGPAPLLTSGIRKATNDEIRRAAKHGKLWSTAKEDLTEGLKEELRKAMLVDARDGQPMLAPSSR